jgi:hypothetical protein
MATLMFEDGSLAIENFKTDFALELLLSCAIPVFHNVVFEFMGSQIGALCEALAALFTHVWFITCVGAHVHNKLLSSCESPATLIAKERFGMLSFVLG